jgi:YbbR domain-containing protein
MVFPQAIPISPVGVGPGLTIQSFIPPIHVVVRRFAVYSNALSASDFPAEINLQGMKAGHYSHVPVILGHASITPLNYYPRYVNIVLDRINKKTVPVRIHPSGSLPYGYALQHGTLTSTPTTIRISGPKPLVEAVHAAWVSPSLTGVKTSINLSYPIRLVNSEGRTLPDDRIVRKPERVRVRATVNQLASFKTVPVTAIVSGRPRNGFGLTAIKVSPSSVTAYGSPQSLNPLQHLRVKAVNISGLRSGGHVFHTTLELPKGVFVPHPDVVVTITTGPVNVEVSLSASVSAENLASGLVASKVKPNQVLVTLDGPSPELTGSTTRLSAVVDLSGLGPGTYRLKPKIIRSADVKVELRRPKHVDVTISR